MRWLCINSIALWIRFFGYVYWAFCIIPFIICILNLHLLKLSEWDFLENLCLSKLLLKGLFSRYQETIWTYRLMSFADTSFITFFSIFIRKHYFGPDEKLILQYFQIENYYYHQILYSECFCVYYNW